MTGPPPSSPPALRIDVLFDADQWREIAQIETLVERAAKAAHTSACRKLDASGPHELSINLSNDANVKDLNHQFRGQNKATNVLSFPFDDDFPELNAGPKPLGDIILAFETISLEARQQDKPLGHHIAHLVVHGVLHLFGYDHIDTEQAEQMEELERNILATLDIPSPYREL